MVADVVGMFRGVSEAAPVFLEFLCVKGGHGMYFLGLNLENRILLLGTKTLISPVSLRANALEVIDTVGDGWA